MDFHALSRRELQTLCKRNGVRANMSNAAMADALRSLSSVDGLDEIGRTVAAPAAAPMSAMESVEEAVIEEEKTDGKLPPGCGRARSKVRSAAADKVEQDVQDQATTLPGSEGAAAREAVAPVEVEEQVIGEKQGHGCPLPRGGHGRARAKTRKAGARKMEEALLAPDTLQENQSTAAGEPVVPGEAEDVATGKRRTRRNRKSKGKMALDQEKEVSVAVQKENADTSDAEFGSVLVASDKSCNDPKEDELVAVVEEEATKPKEGQNVTRTPAVHDEEEERPVPAILRRSQRTVAPVGMAHVEAKEVATGKRRTRRSARVKMALDQTMAEEATVWKELKVVSDKSCNDPKMHEVVVEEEEVTKGQNVTRRLTTHEMEEVPAQAILRQSQSTAATVEAEEVATAKKRTRRSTRSKVAAAQKEQNAGSSETTFGSADKRSGNPKEDEVVAVVKEETTKPHDCGTRAMAHKMEEVLVPSTLQQSQTELEAVVPVEAEEGGTTKRRRRRPRRYKVAAAARNGHKSDADSFDAAIGSPISVLDQNCGDIRGDQLVAGVEEHIAKPQEGIVEEQEQISAIHKSASSGKMEDPPTVTSGKMEDPPTVRVPLKPEAINGPDKAAAIDDEIVKKDCFTLTAKVDQSDLLINTLDKFSKPMYKFTYKEEKKEGECWWMLV